MVKGAKVNLLGVGIILVPGSDLKGLFLVVWYALYSDAFVDAKFARKKLSCYFCCGGHRSSEPDTHISRFVLLKLFAESYYI